MRKFEHNTYTFPLGLWVLHLSISIITTYFALFYIKPSSNALAATHSLIAAWSNWDGAWLISIAAGGYLPMTNKIQGCAAFFPLYPLLMNFLHEITHLFWSYCGVFISNICFLFALILFYKLLLLTQTQQTAKRALWFLVAFPTAMFFNMVYTESLSLLLVLAFFYSMETKHWYGAMLCGALASAVHDLNIVLGLSALVYWYQYKSEMQKTERVVKFLSMALIALGLICFMVFLWHRYDNPFQFMKAESAWNRIWDIPVINIFWSLNKLIHHYNSIPHSEFFMVWLNAFFALLFVIMVKPLYCDKTIPLGQKIFYVITLLLYLSTTVGYCLMAYARFMLILFPGFVVLAKSRVLAGRPIFVSCTLFLWALKIVLTALFSQYYWVI